MRGFRFFSDLVRHSHIWTTTVAIVLSAQIATADDHEKWVSIGSISATDEISHVHISNLLTSHGIESGMVGSVFHAIEVPPDKVAEATRTLRKDALKRHYTFWRENNGEVETVGNLPKSKVLISRTSVADTLKQREFGRNTALGRFLRSPNFRN